MTDDDIRGAILRLTAARASVCPSEVARDLAADWRALMPRVREVAAGMPEVAVTQRGVEVDPRAARGPVRLRSR